jgi:hypothetical protein
MLVLPVGTVVGAPAARLARRQSATSGSTATMRQSGRERPKSTRRHIHVPPWTDCVEVHWSSGGEAYVTPVDDDCVGIAILSSQHGGFDAHFHEFPALRERVLGCQHGPDRAAGPLRQRVASRAAGRVLLVGDAAGCTDALPARASGRRSAQQNYWCNAWSQSAQEITTTSGAG